MNKGVSPAPGLPDWQAPVTARVPAPAPDPTALHPVAGFESRQGVLLVGAVPFTKLAQRWGTPFYASDRGVLKGRVAQLRAALPGAAGLRYAMKANPMTELLRCMVGWVDGIGVASGGELQRALSAGAQP
jgi:diaminopimelate decarboxylase